MGEQDHISEDIELLERLRASDKEALKLIFEKYQPVLFRSVLYNVGDTDLAHDIVQETFVRVWNHRASIRPHLPILAYLFRISRNLIRDQVRRKAVRKQFEAEAPTIIQPTGTNPEESARLSMLEERLSYVVKTHLPSKCREIFLLSRLEGLSHAEISKRLGISPKTVENQITRALKVLRRYLRSYLQEKGK
ncbi:MAG TPA: RNA polymerase sigma-70 factor [Bacteroidota bacterium]|nr:RNA polymerase sigma-70 factor [Bacteroidota bacterium]